LGTIPAGLWSLDYYSTICTRFEQSPFLNFTHHWSTLGQAKVSPAEDLHFIRCVRHGAGENLSISNEGFWKVAPITIYLLSTWETHFQPRVRNLSPLQRQVAREDSGVITSTTRCLRHWKHSVGSFRIAYLHEESFDLKPQGGSLVRW